MWKVNFDKKKCWYLNKAFSGKKGAFDSQSTVFDRLNLYSICTKNLNAYSILFAITVSFLPRWLADFYHQ